MGSVYDPDWSPLKEKVEGIENDLAEAINRIEEIHLMVSAIVEHLGIQEIPIPKPEQR